MVKVTGSSPVLPTTIKAADERLLSWWIFGASSAARQNLIITLLVIMLNGRITAKLFAAPFARRLALAPKPVRDFRAQPCIAHRQKPFAIFARRQAPATNRHDTTAASQTYSVEAVPALIEALDDRTADTNHAGWTLAVAYENPALPLRNLTI